MTSNFVYLSFSTLHSSSLWRTDISVSAKSNKPPSSEMNPLYLLSPPPTPSNVFEIKKPPRGLIREFNLSKITQLSDIFLIRAAHISKL